jgi:hypothetical protein
MLVFERLSHLFEVNEEQFSIRLRVHAFLAATTVRETNPEKEIVDGDNSSKEGATDCGGAVQRNSVGPFDFTTSPTPVALCNIWYFLTCERGSGVSLNSQEFAEQTRLDGSARLELSTVFGDSFEHFALAHPDVFVVKPLEEETPSELYLWTHALWLVHRKATELSAAPATYGEKRWTDRVLAEAIRDSLPTENDEVVVWSHHSRWMLDQYKEIIPPHLLASRKLCLDFFRRYPDLFVTFELIVNTPSSFLIARSGSTAPLGCHPRHCKTLRDAVRELAMVTIGGSELSNIYKNVSQGGRDILKQYNGVEHVARCLPMWFEVKGGGIDEQKREKTCVVTYIGADAANGVVVGEGDVSSKAESMRGMS